VAGLLRPRLAAAPGVAAVDITGPGFLNITLAADDAVRRALSEGDHYGHGGALSGHRYRLRPAPHLRAEVTADALARLLQAAGADTGPAPGDGDAPEIPVTPAPPPGDPAVLEARYGTDALRWAFLRTPAGNLPRLTATLLEQREPNQLFRIRYAHSRTCALARNAADLGIRHTQRDGPAQARAADHPAARALRTVIGDLPTVVESAARHRAPDRLARHLVQLADAFLRFQSDCPPLPMGDEATTDAHHARLELTAAAGTALANGLTLLGVSAPERV
jgi:arginyl-tRNA synthetase